MLSKSKGRLALGFIFAAALLIPFFKGIDWAALIRAFRTADLFCLLGLLLSTLLAYVVRAWRWGYLLAPLARVPLGKLFSFTVVGFMSGFVIPRAGEILRPYLVGRHSGIRTSAAFASIILERLVDLITVILFFGAYLYVLPLPAEQQGGTTLQVFQHAGLLGGLLALCILIVLILFHVFAERAVSFVERLLSRFPQRLARPLVHALRAFAEGLAVLKAPWTHLLAIAVQSVLLWLAIAAGFYFNNLAFGIVLPFQSTLLMLAFLTVGVTIPTPGMVGGFHEFYLLSLQNFGIDKAIAVAAGISAHAVSNLPVILLGVIFLGREGLTMGRVAEMADQADETPNGSEPKDAAPESGRSA